MKADQSMLPGVAVEALHVPTGTRYTAVTAANGRYNILNVRVGGPYTVTAQISGFRASTQKDVNVALGESRQVNFALELESVTESVVVTAESAPLISPDRMGSGIGGLRERRSRPCRPSAGSSRTSPGRTRTSTSP